MKKNSIFTLLLLTLPFTQLKAQTDNTEPGEPQGYNFVTINDVETSPVKDQHRSGTCWSFAATSFIETEILRQNNLLLDLSEMYFVRHTYQAKAIHYIQRHGTANLSAGGQAHDVMNVLRTQGMATETSFPGLNYGEENHTHGELDAMLHGMADAVIKNKNNRLSTIWPQAISSVLDVYLGTEPTTFEIDNKTYTPASLRDDMKLNPDDYIEITSYTHHPFYQPFILEIPDNWSNEQYYNVPLNDLMQIIDHALNKGYSVCWDGDVSDKGFSYRSGVAIVPVEKIDDMQGTEQARWEKLTKEELAKKRYAFEEPVPEKTITQTIRQEAFERFQSTDDHLMHLTGSVKDQNGTVYYRTKNSWADDSNDMKGYLNMSTSYLRLNTVAIMIHKNALPKALRKRLSIK